MNVFIANDYRVVIEERVLELKSKEAKMTFQKLSDQTRIAKSYISRVVGRKAHLNVDQLFLVSKNLEFSEKERQYIDLLHQMQTTVVQERKKVLREQIKGLQREALQSKYTLKQNPVAFDDAFFTGYFGDPLNQLAHICLTVPRFQNHPNLIADSLGLPPARLRTCFAKLEELGVVRRIDGKYQVVIEHLHLPKDAQVYPYWRNAIKSLCLHRLEHLPRRDDYSFAVTFAATESTMKQIHAEFLSFIRKAQEWSIEGNKEQVYQLCFDLFPWTGA